VFFTRRDEANIGIRMFAVPKCLPPMTTLKAVSTDRIGCRARPFVKLGNDGLESTMSLFAKPQDRQSGGAVQTLIRSRADQLLKKKVESRSLTSLLKRAEFAHL
jgi:hypothetical protein